MAARTVTAECQGCHVKETPIVGLENLKFETHFCFISSIRTGGGGGGMGNFHPQFGKSIKWGKQ